MPDIEWIKKTVAFFVEEGKVIRQAPVSFVIAVLFCSGIIALLLYAFYQERFVVLNERIQFYQVRLDSPGSGISHKDIVKILEKTSIQERVSQLQADNTIRLTHLPLPETVRIVINSLSYDLDNPGLQLEGEKIIVSNPSQPGIQFLDVLRGEFAEGDTVKIEYRRAFSAKDLEEILK